MVYEWLQDLPAWGLALLRVILIVGALLTLVPGLIWFERRLLSWMQDRIGPNLTGTINLPNGKKLRTFGFLQPIADGVKLFMKEDITPNAIDRAVYFIAPAIALFPAFALGGTLPWGPDDGFYALLTPIADVEIGILYVLAISSLGAYGTVLAGYASNNKYSLMGGLRASAQLISYELAMGVSLAAVVLATGSLKMTEMVNVQEQALWGVDALSGVQNWFIFTPWGFISAVVFLVAMVAETNRAPFDLPEAENELIAGYHTEYSSMKFAVFFMGEYAAMFVLSGVFATVFMGGHNLMPVNWDVAANTFPAASGVLNGIGQAMYWLAPLGFLAKCAAGMFLFIWIRATLPRLRYDQLMNIGWKGLLPVAVANFIITGIWILVTDIYGDAAGWGAFAGSLILAIVLYLQVVNGLKRKEPAREAMVMTDGRGAILTDGGNS